MDSMVDHLSREGRSRNMAEIRAKDTKPELALRRALHAAGIRGWRCHARGIAGKPDLAFTRWKVAVFVDGAFWHGHPDHFSFGRGGYWDAKIARTQERDRIANETLRMAGWTVLRFWDFEVNEDIERCARAVLDALESAGRPVSGASSSTSSLLPAS
jgi:DNA mismatch endonuclease (patch repair protein)